jgi:cytochrome b involved in lipid metabolism
MEPQEPKVGITKYIIGIVTIVIIILLVSIYGSSRVKPEETTSAPKESINTTGETAKKPDANKTFTMAEVSTHSTKDSCYSAVRGTVYDLTSWIYKHPGGANNILKICGKDGTSAFTGKHEGEPKPEQILAGFEIGTLAK